MTGRDPTVREHRRSHLFYPFETLVAYTGRAFRIGPFLDKKENSPSTRVPLTLASLLWLVCDDDDAACLLTQAGESFVDRQNRLRHHYIICFWIRQADDQQSPLFGVLMFLLLAASIMHDAFLVVLSKQIKLDTTITTVTTIDTYCNVLSVGMQFAEHSYN